MRYKMTAAAFVFIAIAFFLLFTSVDEDLKGRNDALQQQSSENGADSESLFVSLEGDDTWSGRLPDPDQERTDGPFKTFGRAVEEVRDITESGNHSTVNVYIRGGRYEEEFAAEGLSGTSDSPVIFKSYPGEEVLIDGTRELNTEWQQHSGHIYSTRVDQDIWQLFIDRDMVQAARWPNAGFDDGSIWYYERSRRGLAPESTVGSVTDTEVQSFGLARYEVSENVREPLSESGIDFTGGVVIILSHWWTWASEVTRHEAGSESFNYSTDFPKGFLADFADPMLQGDWSWAQLNYHLMGLMALNRAGEWWYDQETNTAYLWAPDDADPNDLPVRGRVRDINMRIENSKHLQFDGIDLFAGSFRITDSDDIKIENADLLFSSYPKLMLGDFSTFTGNVLANSNRITVRNCEMAHSAGLVMSTWGGGDNLVDNCYIHHNSWIPLHNGGIIHMMGSTIRRSTIHTSGAPDAIWKPQIAELNRIHDIGGLANDCAGIQAGNMSHFAYSRNWAHDLRLHGLRFDDEVYHGSYNRNVIWDVLTNSIKGNDHLVYNNTTVNVRSTGDIEIARTFESEFRDDEDLNTRTVSKNNLSVLSGSAWDLTELPGTSGHNLTDGEVHRHLRDPDNLDFRPKKDSPLPEAGTVVEPPDTYEGPLFDWDWVVGEKPDIGAYEKRADYYWIPGHRRKGASVPVPPDNAENVKLDADLMFLEAYKGKGHIVYFGTNPDELEKIEEVKETNIVNPGALEEMQSYYWRVDTIGENEEISEGEVWKFTTGSSD